MLKNWQRLKYYICPAFDKPEYIVFMHDSFQLEAYICLNKTMRAEWVIVGEKIGIDSQIFRRTRSRVHRLITLDGLCLENTLSFAGVSILLHSTKWNW